MSMNVGAGEIAVIIGVVVAFGAFLLWGNRPTADRFAATNGLELDDDSRATVAIALRRTYRGRVLGGAAGFVIAVVIAALGATSLNFAGGLAAIFAGSLVGVALAQLTRSPSTDPTPIASLEARDAQDYRPRRASTFIVVTLAALVGYGVVMILSYDVNRVRAVVTAVAVGLVALATVALSAWLQRRIVEQAQDHRNPEHARVDDALRAGAVRAVHHAVMGILLCGLTLLAVTGATSTETAQVERNGVRVLALPGDGHDFKITANGDAASVTWIGADGVVQVTSLPPTHNAGDYVVTGRTTSGSFDISPIVAISFWLAFIAVFGALFEWRAAARSWRRPSPRRRSEIATPDAAPPSELAIKGGPA
jgi:hypothetical protein